MLACAAALTSDADSTRHCRPVPSLGGAEEPRCCCCCCCAPVQLLSRLPATAPVVLLAAVSDITDTSLLPLRRPFCSSV